MNNTYDMISTFLETVEKNLESKNFTIDSMQNIFYSSSNFTKIFKRFFNITPVNYIKKRKLSEIAKRLRISNDSILDIALDYEYSNPSSFERAFRREFGISTSQYRKEVDLSTNLYEAININGDNLRNMILGNPYYSPLAYFLDELFGLKPKSTMVKWNKSRPLYKFETNASKTTTRNKSTLYKILELYIKKEIHTQHISNVKTIKTTLFNRTEKKFFKEIIFKKFRNDTYALPVVNLFEIHEILGIDGQEAATFLNNIMLHRILIIYRKKCQHNEEVLYETDISLFPKISYSSNSYHIEANQNFIKSCVQIISGSK